MSFVQSVAAMEWTIKHNLGRTVGVDVFLSNADGLLEKVLPSEVIKLNENTVKIMFDEPIAGEATVA
jgi:hypothetical protein